MRWEGEGERKRDDNKFRTSIENAFAWAGHFVIIARYHGCELITSSRKKQEHIAVWRSQHYITIC